MGKKRRLMTLDKYPRVEQPEAPQKTGREELDVQVVHLNHRDQPSQIHRLFEIIWPPYDNVDGESEEMLTVRIAANGMILSVAPPPGRYFPGLIAEGGYQPE